MIIGDAKAAMGTRPSRQNHSMEKKDIQVKKGLRKKIWIDLDNSPHVPFFLPIIEELRKRGHEVILTARDSYQVCELLEFHHISCKVIGGHWGKHRALKILGTFARATRLVKLMLTERPDLTVSHGSRAQILCSYVLRIPSVAIGDYEFTARMGIVSPDWVFTPHFISDPQVLKAKKQVMKYPGLKEEVYVPRFKPDPSLRGRLGLETKDLVVTVRPPATEAHYHNQEAEVLLIAALNLLVHQPEVKVILLPRNEKQAKTLRAEWGEWITKKKIVIPSQVVDGLNLIWFSDLVISGGGTMNREAAALGVPVYSIFRGRIGAVDRHLAAEGRLVLLESVEDVRSKVILERRRTALADSSGDSTVLNCIVDGIISIAEYQCLPDHH
jgi:predicted glycosyltransferase